MKKELLAIVMLVVLFACNKSDDNSNQNNNTTNPTPLPTKRELITAKPWKYYAWVATPPVKDSLGNDVSDIYNYKPACQRDDILIFYTNSNVDFDQGPTKCDPNDQQTTTSSWFFNTAETTVNLGSNAYTLDKLSKDTLKLSFNDMVAGTHHHVITLVH